MNSKITFLGTAGDIFLAGKQVLSTGGIVVETDGMQFHLDPGPGSLVMANHYEINVRNNTAVLLSSPDLVFSNDVNVMLSAMSYDGIDKKGVLIAPKSACDKTEEGCPVIHDRCKDYVEKVIALDNDSRVGINEVEIRSLPTYGTDNRNIGFKFFTSKFVLIYSSNTGYNEELVEYYKNADILILNVANPGSQRKKGLMCTDDVIKLTQKVKPKMLILTGFGIKMHQVGLLNESRKIQKETGVQTVAAKDGYVVSPSSYNVRMKQQILRNFKN